MLEKRGHTLDVLFPLGVLAIYAVAAALVLLLAADGYRDSLDRADRSFGASTALAYVTEKLRAGDREDADEAMPAADNENNNDFPCDPRWEALRKLKDNN